MSLFILGIHHSSKALRLLFLRLVVIPVAISDGDSSPRLMHLLMARCALLEPPVLQSVASILSFCVID